MFVKILIKNVDGVFRSTIFECYKASFQPIPEDSNYWKEGEKLSLLQIYNNEVPNGGIIDYIVNHRADDFHIYYLNSEGQTIDKVV